MKNALSSLIIAAAVALFVRVTPGWGASPPNPPISDGNGNTASAHAKDGCQRVHGRIQSTFTSTNCTSPVGLCTEGKITNAGPLNSATTFLALDVAPSAGMPSVEPSANLSYSGVLTIVAREGTLVTHDLGVLDAATTSFTELERPASGTGIFTHASNAFFISGAIVNDGTGFDGELYGVLCIGGLDRN
jgi:hypothetical protein